MASYTLTVTCPTGHGTPPLSVGDHIYDDETQVIVEAPWGADSGYELDHIVTTYNFNSYYSQSTTLVVMNQDTQMDFYYRPVISGNAGFTVLYFDVTAKIWKKLSGATVKNVVEELNGSVTATFSLVNTTANIALVGLDAVDNDNVYVRIAFGTGLTIVFYGVVSGGTFVDGAPSFECLCYDAAVYAIEQAPNNIVHNYDNKTVFYIAYGVVNTEGGCDLEINQSGSAAAITKLGTYIYMKFNGQTALEALKMVCAKFGLLFWGTSTIPNVYNSATLNIGDRNTTTRNPSVRLIGGSHTFDRLKVKTKVIIKGLDTSDNDIVGSAGTTGATFTDYDMEATDTDTLNDLATQKLAELSNPTISIDVPLLTSQAYLYHTGEYLTVSKANLVLDDDYLITQLTKEAVTTSAELAVTTKRDNTLIQDNTSGLRSLAFRTLGTAP